MEKSGTRARARAALNPERAIFAARVRYPSPLSIKAPHLLEVIKTERAARSQAYFTSVRMYVCALACVCDSSNLVNQRPRRSVGWLVTSRDDSDTRPAAIIHSRELPNLVTSRI